MTLDQAFQMGQKSGRQEVVDELLKLLGLPERIAKDIRTHEEQMHSDDLA